LSGGPRLRQVITAVLALWLAGCSVARPSAGLEVVASFYPLLEFTSLVGGDRVAVRQLTPTGTSPHDYEPTPGDVAALKRARVFVYNGAGLEPWADRLRAELGRGALAVEATRGLPLVKLEEEEEREAGREPHREQLDPHAWLDPVLAQAMVDNVAGGLAQADPEGADFYRRRARELKDRLARLHARYAEGLRGCRGQVLVTSHRAFGYLARRYRLRLLSVAGLSHEAEPSPRRLKHLLSAARRAGVRAVYAETLAGRKAVEGLARELGARVLVLNPVEGLTEEDRRQGRGYFELMEENLRALRDGLGCP
jgi:zinc transport system substrate-binding protein